MWCTLWKDLFERGESGSKILSWIFKVLFPSEVMWKNNLMGSFHIFLNELTLKGNKKTFVSSFEKNEAPFCTSKQ